MVYTIDNRGHKFIYKISEDAIHIAQLRYHY
ncbi:MAG: type II toxin-antitoxin system YoeB family toxin [Desulfobacterium sp.]|nr:type II toxin-antitoxin system YoeB family toxin [Desulfobacterium sp.]MBU3949876.1 type II toxin-antitoxin system YoeB family toxin [Pseudomonadota bacterium]